jgi:hypothetical protein
MGIFDFLKKPNISYRHEDYSDIYLRWKIGGKEYGPMAVSEIPSREPNWSGLPINFRFDNDHKWQKYNTIKKIALKLLASQSQIKILLKYRIPFNNETLTYIEADALIKNKVTPIKEKEKEDKEKLPATKQTLNKLDSLNITYAQNINRKEAKALINKHKQIESTEQLLSSLSEKNVDVASIFNIAEISKNEKNETIFISNLEELDEQLQFLEKMKIKFNMPSKMDVETLSSLTDNLSLLDEYIDTLSDYNIKFDIPSPMDNLLLRKHVNSLENSLEEIDEIDSQLDEKEIYIKEGDYKISGSLPKAKMTLFLNEVFNKTIEGNWNFDRDIINHLKKHFPNIKIKDLYD